METRSAVRARRSIREALYEIDFEPAPRMVIIFCPEWKAQALADYNAECRARPDVQMPDFETEYVWDWLDAKLHDEAEQAADEARRAPLPLTSPCGDADEDIPW